MKDKYILDLNTGEEFQSFFLVLSKEVKTDSRGKQYLNLLLGDKTGEIQAKKWDVPDEELSAFARFDRGSLVKIKAVVNEWNGAKQLKIQKIRPVTDEDGTEHSDYYKAAPEDPNKMYDYVMGCAEKIKDSDLQKISIRVLQDNKEKLLYYPAAAKNHHAEFAGLLWHLKRMLMMAERWVEVYDFINIDILYCGVILHDIEKLNEMDSDENGLVSEYSFKGVLLGHLVQGASSITLLAEELKIPEEKKVMLEHMAISHHYEPEFGSPRRPMFPEAEALHYLDMIDAKMYDFEDALAGVEEGDFSDRIWTLDNRRIYKRTF